MSLVDIRNNQPVTTSLQVSERFEKEHKVVLKAIDELKEGVAQNYADLFYEDTYIHPQNKQVYRLVIMTKKGWTLLAMGFTGKKATKFKLDYINAFDEMEEQLKQQPISNPNLSPELQIMQGLLNQMATQEQAIANNQRDNQRIEHKVDNISEIVAIDSRDWRNKTNSILRKIAIKQGGFDVYQEIGNESYMRLEKRGRCNLDIRLENRRKNMIAQGVGKTKVKKLNKLDIIADDSRLTEIYLSVVKDMAIKYGVHLEEEIVREA